VTPPPSRVVDLDGCLNFRDLGGYRGDGGRMVRWRQVFRSDSLHRATDTGVATLVDELGIRTVIDLRSRREQERSGPSAAAESPGVRTVHLPMVDDVHARPDGSRPPVTDMGVAYLRMIEIGQAAVAETMRLLAEPANLPAAFFCAAGKDRTGALAAIILGLLGVSDEDIVADYALTAPMAPAIIERSRADSPELDETWKRLPTDALGAPAHVMASMVAGLHAEHGTWEAYAGGIGLGPDVLTALRDALLE
jgi:protein-tyrosine phosphatase